MIGIYINGNGKRIYSNHEFFKDKDRVIVKSTNEKMVITLATIDFEGRTLKVLDMKNGWFMITFTGECPIGTKFEFDPDESTIDEAIIYFDR